MQESVRDVLIRSRIAAITIGILLFWFMDLTFQAAAEPLWRLLVFLFTAIAIVGIPYVSLGLPDRLMLYMSLLYLVEALVSLLVAWVFSRWTYGVGPLPALKVLYTAIMEKGRV